jgi:hypothetical protein
LCEPGYVGRSPTLDASRLINFYPELSPKTSKGPVALIGTPGLSLWTSAGASVVRGMHVFKGLLFVVVAGQLYSITALGVVSASLGQLTTSTGRVLMSDNALTVAGAGGNQLMITDGVNGYVYNVNTAAFSTISGGGWPGNPIALAYIDGYFVVAPSGSMTGYASDLYDGTTWNSLSESPVSAVADFIQGIANLQQQLWFIKQYSSECWFDAGTSPSVGFPFQRQTNAVFDFGTPAPASISRGSNGIFFLLSPRENDSGGMLGAAYISGQTFTPEQIVPPPIAYLWSQYSTVSDAFGYCYADGGHEFWVLTFPTANATWCYDATTKFWHERSGWTGNPYATARHVSNCYANFNGLHLVGDYESGNIYQMSGNTYQDIGDPIVSTRVFQPVYDAKNLSNLFFKRFILDLETGVGNSLAPSPSAALSWSDDGGHTWSSDYLASIGKQGEYRARAIWRRLGCSRSRTFRVSISDPVKKVLIGAYAE